MVAFVTFFAFLLATIEPSAFDDLGGVDIVAAVVVPVVIVPAFIVPAFMPAPALGFAVLSSIMFPFMAKLGRGRDCVIFCSIAWRGGRVRWCVMLWELEFQQLTRRGVAT
ncbi:MAG: hypothetical protein ACXVKC_16910 [Candidatus Angelobacter sp.]